MKAIHRQGQSEDTGYGINFQLQPMSLPTDNFDNTQILHYDE